MEPWGRTPWFYRGDGCEKCNRLPRSPSPPQYTTTSYRGYAPAIPILSHQNRVGRFAFPSRPGLFSHRGDTGQKAFLWPAWAQEFKGWPNSFDGRPNKGWAHERPELRRTSLKGASIHNRVPTGLT